MTKYLSTTNKKLLTMNYYDHHQYKHYTNAQPLSSWLWEATQGWEVLQLPPMVTLVLSSFFFHG
jgi:hypothetical protein